jgi:hypothetical protein
MYNGYRFVFVDAGAAVTLFPMAPHYSFAVVLLGDTLDSDRAKAFIVTTALARREHVSYLPTVFEGPP